MLLAQLADVSTRVAATPARNEKIALLAATLAALEPAEIAPAIGFLTGAPRQGAIGVGWATLSGLDLPPPGQGVSITELDRTLERLRLTAGPGSSTARRQVLTELLAAATGSERDLIIRILTGEVRQGALAGVLTAATALAAGVTQTLLRRAVMLEGDLGRAAVVALGAGAEGLAAIDLTVGRPVQPMLASTAGDVAGAIAALGTAQVDWKLDGARIQVHRDGDRIGIYTRNLNDVTARLPQVVELVGAMECRSVVLDGEVIGLAGDGADAGPATFGDTMRAFGSEPTRAGGPAPATGLRAFFFDLLHLDGVSLIDRPLLERTGALHRLAPRDTVPRLVTDDPIQAGAHLTAALQQGHEGVVVKAVDSRYEAGRRGGTWLKVKPVHTLDLVVLAAEWGHGRRRGWLSNLHLGAIDPLSGRPVMVGKTFKGLSDELLAWQTRRFGELRVGDDDGGRTVRIRPELVVEIAVDGAQTSSRYPGGVALRFARVRAYRPDKNPADADTLDAVRALL